MGAKNNAKPQYCKSLSDYWIHGQENNFDNGK